MRLSKIIALASCVAMVSCSTQPTGTTKRQTVNENPQLGMDLIEEVMK